MVKSGSIVRVGANRRRRTVTWVAEAGGALCDPDDDSPPTGIEAHDLREAAEQVLPPAV